jgi:hypothetical protein
MKDVPRRKKIFIKVVEILVLACVNWLNPGAILAVVILKLCFLFLEQR